jgi:predicted RNA binding protein with dsRBD fold (UPF0201 family)
LQNSDDTVLPPELAIEQRSKPKVDLSLLEEAIMNMLVRDTARMYHAAGMKDKMTTGMTLDLQDVLRTLSEVSEDGNKAFKKAQLKFFADSIRRRVDSLALKSLQCRDKNSERGGIITETCYKGLENCVEMAKAIKDEDGAGDMAVTETTVAYGKG